MGPTPVKHFRGMGAELIADRYDYTAEDTEIDTIVADSGQINILIRHFAGLERF